MVVGQCTAWVGWWVVGGGGTWLQSGVSGGGVVRVEAMLSLLLLLLLLLGRDDVMLLLLLMIIMMMMMMMMYIYNVYIHDTQFNHASTYVTLSFEHTHKHTRLYLPNPTPPHTTHTWVTPCVQVHAHVAHVPPPQPPALASTGLPHYDAPQHYDWWAAALLLL